MSRGRVDAFALLIAQGFGVGRIPVAPGSFGTVLGFGWFLALNATNNFWLYLAGSAGGLALSVWACGRAEKLLGQPDPGSVVLDEIAAFPLCLLVPVVWVAWKSGAQLAPLGLFYNRWPCWLAMFAAFRLFDIWKPWPVRQSQRLPGGWGITVDDALAAAYTNCLWLPLWL